MNAENQDWLTGLSTRLLLQERFLQHISQECDRLALILIDIDGFIYCNDRYGHSEGDNILKQIAQLICQIMPPHGEAFRTGGDKFTILLPESNLSTVVSVAEQIRQQVENQFSDKLLIHRLCSLDFSVCTTTESSFTITCGIAFYPENGTDWRSVLMAADNAMYEGAKQLGGNKVALASLAKKPSSANK